MSFLIDELHYDNNMRVFSRNKLNQMFILIKELEIIKTSIENINMYIYINILYN